MKYSSLDHFVHTAVSVLYMPAVNQSFYSAHPYSTRLYSHFLAQVRALSLCFGLVSYLRLMNLSGSLAEELRNP